MSEFSGPLLAESLCRHFSQSIEVREGHDRWSILLPMVDDLGDPLRLAIWRHGGQWVLSDDGFVHREVALRTASEDPEDRVWDEVQVAARGFDLNWGGGQLWIELEEDKELGGGVMRMAEAMLMAVQAAGQFVSEVKVRFWEEVRLFFDDEKVPYRRNQRFVGISEVSHRIDFTLRNGHIHLVQAIASESSMRRSLNVFYDVLEVQPDIVPIAFIDDAKAGYSNETFEQLAYKSDVFFWKDRGRFVDYWSSVT